MSYDSWKQDDQHDPLFEPYGPRRTEDYERPPDPESCDRCGSTSVRITIAGVGQFCGSACAQVGLDQHEAALLGKQR